MLDLASARAILSGGSFTVLTESLAIRKPILSIPIKGQFEQEMNAFYLEKSGYGKGCETITKEIIEDFLNYLDFYKDNLRDYKSRGNEELFQAIDVFISNIQALQ